MISFSQVRVTDFQERTARVLPMDLIPLYQVKMVSMRKIKMNSSSGFVYLAGGEKNV